MPLRYLQCSFRQCRISLVDKMLASGAKTPSYNLQQGDKNQMRACSTKRDIKTRMSRTMIGTIMCWRACGRSRGAAGVVFFEACVLISSPYSLAWPWNLISRTCNMLHPLSWPMDHYRCRKLARHQHSTPAVALPRITHSLEDVHALWHPGSLKACGVMCVGKAEHLRVLLSTITVLLHVCRLDHVQSCVDVHGTSCVWSQDHHVEVECHEKQQRRLVI